MKRFLFAIILLSPVVLVAASSGFVFKSDLFVGIKSNEVLELQKVLNSATDTTVATTGPGSRGQETNYFGEKTKQAVIKFQEKYKDEVLAPASLSSGTGFVGALTRKKLNQIYEILHLTASSTVSNSTSTNTVSNIIYASSIPKSNTYSTSTPVITSVSPTYWQDNQAVRVIGTGFTASNTIVISIEPDNKYTGLASESVGTVIPFVLSTQAGLSLSNSLSRINQNVRGYVIQHIMKTYRSGNGLSNFNQDGIYTQATVRVRNENGLSDPYKVYINLLRN